MVSFRVCCGLLWRSRYPFDRRRPVFFRMSCSGSALRSKHMCGETTSRSFTSADKRFAVEGERSVQPISAIHCAALEVAQHARSWQMFSQSRVSEWDATAWLHLLIPTAELDLARHEFRSVSAGWRSDSWQPRTELAKSASSRYDPPRPAVGRLGQSGAVISILQIGPLGYRLCSALTKAGARPPTTQTLVSGGCLPINGAMTPVMPPSSTFTTKSVAL